MSEPDSTPGDARMRVYDAVRHAWRREVRRRVQRRQFAISAVCLLAVVSSVLVLWPGRSGVGSHTVARVERAVGTVELLTDSGAARPRTLTGSGLAIAPGDVLRTSAGSRAGLHRAGGIAIHVGGDTELAWQSTDALRLTRGVVYIDTDGDTARADRLEVITHNGRIRHIGTRFSVEVDNLEVEVRVRDGAVSFDEGRNAERIGAGQAARIDRNGRVTAARFVTGDGPWQWLKPGLPQFVVEGRSLHEVLHDMARAAGLPLRYVSPPVEAKAHELVLHGPELDLAARDAIDAVLLTTQFERIEPLQIVARGAPR
jgi:ferric-dicitrate binding protein FerR (iron transport regulator)